MTKKNKPSLLKKIIKALPALFGIAAVVYLGVMVKDIEWPTVLPVNEVKVNGDLIFLNKEAIESIVSDNVSGGFFTVDLQHIREILFQQPWVKSVSLRRRWPAGLDVFIEEHKPVAYWNDDGYISQSGSVFKPEVIDKNLNLPVLSGPEAQHSNVWKFMNVLYRKMAALNYAVTSLRLDERRAWRLEILNAVNVEAAGNAKGIAVRLGRFDTEKRMQRFIRILPALASKKEFSDNEIQVIDMRYPNGFAVRMTDEELAVKKTIVSDSIIKNKLTTQNFSHNFTYEIHAASVRMNEA